MTEGATRSLRRARAALAAGLVALFAMAPDLWLAHPFCTQLSAFGSQPSLAAPWDAVVLGGLALLLVPIVFLRAPLPWTIAWCLLLATRAGWDSALWQPYLLQYGVMLGVAGTMTSAQRAPTGTSILRGCMVAVYLWSGFAKLHWTFLESGWAVVLGDADIDAYPLALRVATGLGAALGELVFGLLLLTRWRRTAVLGLCAMHAMIFWSLGPWGRSVNAIVWPWNVVMVALLRTLFWPGTRSSGIRALRHPLAIATLLLMGLGPALSYAGAWPASLSFRLYAARSWSGYIALTERGIAQLPPEQRDHVIDQPAGGGYPGFLNLGWLCEDLVGAQAPANALTLRSMATRWFRQCADPSQGLLLLQGPPPLTDTARPQRTYRWQNGTLRPANP